jgi:type I restriction enzyme S subunit
MKVICRQPLKNVASIIMGQSPAGETYNHRGEGLPFFQGKADFGAIYPIASTWCAAPIKIADVGDILISVRAPVGPTNLSKDRCCIGRGLAAIRPIGEKAYRDYLWYYLTFVKADLEKKGQGSTFESINSNDLSTLDIPMPSINDQVLIADRLKAQMAEIEKAHQALTVELREIENLSNALILESIRKTQTKNYSLGDVIAEVKNGIGIDWSTFPVWGATREGLAPAKEPPGKNPQRYKPAFPGTVFYNPMRILIGSVAFVDEDDKPGITSPDYVVLTGKEGIVDSRWFYFWLRSPLGKQCITSLARGAVRERMLFNRFAEGYIELPEFKLQQAASKALAELKHLRKAIEIKMNEINLLPAKILSQTFEM